MKYICVIFRWHLSEWLPCMETCGDGIQTRFVYCDQQINSTYHRQVANSKCDPKKKPTILTRPCDLPACPPQWEAGPWSEVSSDVSW